MFAKKCASIFKTCCVCNLNYNLQNFIKLINCYFNLLWPLRHWFFLVTSCMERWHLDKDLTGQLFLQLSWTNLKIGAIQRSSSNKWIRIEALNCAVGLYIKRQIPTQLHCPTATTVKQQQDKLDGQQESGMGLSACSSPPAAPGSRTSCHWCCCCSQWLCQASASSTFVPTMVCSFSNLHMTTLTWVTLQSHYL